MRMSLLLPASGVAMYTCKVADLERSLAFYCGVLGFELTQRYGTSAAFISASIALDGPSDRGVSEALYL